MLALSIIATICLLFLCIISIIVAKEDNDYVFYAILTIFNSATILYHIW